MEIIVIAVLFSILILCDVNRGKQIRQIERNLNELVEALKVHAESNHNNLKDHKECIESLAKFLKVDFQNEPIMKVDGSKVIVVANKKPNKKIKN